MDHTQAATSRDRPIVLTIAGSDSGGGAGIQADLKTFAALGCFGASAITAITAQNSRGVQAATVLEPDMVVRQIDSVASDLRVAATKTGMLAGKAIVAAVADAIGRHNLSPLVVDPVMIAKSGDSLIDDEAIEAVTKLLLPLATLVTPNRHEAARLTGFAVDTAGEAARAAEVICLRHGAGACVVKGIHAKQAGVPVAMDLVFGDEDDPYPLIRPWRDTRQTHGSGCTFSAAIAAGLARGLGLRDALEAARSCIEAAMISLHRPTLLGAPDPTRVISVDHLATAQ